jgi:FkbM family methyltransferase
MNEEELKTKILSYTGLSNSQLKQDIFVLYCTEFKRKGFFVEFGACDGLYLSNTLLLEKEYDWQGILSEPLRSFHEKLKENRNCIIDNRAVYKESNLKTEFRELSDHKDLSGIVETFSNDNHTKKRNHPTNENYIVNTISLNDLLKTHNAPIDIDFISIDTEGSEFEILAAFDLDAYKVKIFTIEHNYIEDKRNKIYNLLISKNYKRILTDISEWDDWYILKD